MKTISRALVLVLVFSVFSPVYAITYRSLIENRMNHLIKLEKVYFNKLQEEFKDHSRKKKKQKTLSDLLQRHSLCVVHYERLEEIKRFLEKNPAGIKQVISELRKILQADIKGMKIVRLMPLEDVERYASGTLPLKRIVVIPKEFQNQKCD